MHPPKSFHFSRASMGRAAAACLAAFQGAACPAAQQAPCTRQHADPGSAHAWRRGASWRTCTGCTCRRCSGARRPRWRGGPRARCAASRGTRCRGCSPLAAASPPSWASCPSPKWTCCCWVRAPALPCSLHSAVSWCAWNLLLRGCGCSGALHHAGSFGAGSRVASSSEGCFSGQWTRALIGFALLYSCVTSHWLVLCRPQPGRHHSPRGRGLARCVQ